MREAKFKVYAVVEGIKVRCRKPSREVIQIGYMPLDGDKSLMRVAAKARILQTMKICSNAALHFDYVEQSEHMEEWIIFDKRHIREQLTIVAGKWAA